VWQPDAETLERREVFSAYQAVVKESTRVKQQIKAMLNEHCVRLGSGFRLSHPRAIARLLKLKEWSPVQPHHPLWTERRRRRHPALQQQSQIGGLPWA
jgi:hypothetical protein